MKKAMMAELVTHGELYQIFFAIPEKISEFHNSVINNYPNVICIK
jgi:hypothetical protein